MEFVEKALELTDRKVAMFLKLTFLESKKRRDLFRTNPPSTVYVFTERILCAKNGDFIGSRKQGSAVAYAWYIWDKRDQTKKTLIKWL